MQKKIKEQLQRNIPYVHCFNHRLHLVIVHLLADETELQEFFDLCDSLYKFIRKPNIHVRYHGTVLKRLLDQRWSGHLDTVASIIASYDELVSLLELVKTTRIGTTDVRVEATGLLLHVDSVRFRFLARFVFRILSIFKPADKILQRRDVSLLTAVGIIRTVTEAVSDMCSSNAFDECWDLAAVVSAETGAVSEGGDKRRRAASTRLADSVVYESSGQWEQSMDGQKIEMKRLFIAAIDSITLEMNSRFNEQDMDYLGVLEATEPKSTYFLSA